MTDSLNDNSNIPEDSSTPQLSQLSEQVVETTIVFQQTDAPEEFTEVSETQNKSGMKNVEEISPEVLEKFDNLYDDLFEITLPNTLWGVHRDPDRKFIVFSQFSLNKMGLSKVYIIYNSLQTEIMVNGVIVAQELIDTTDSEFFTNVIAALDSRSVE